MNADDEDVVALDGGWDYDEDEEDEVPEDMGENTLRKALSNNNFLVKEEEAAMLKRRVSSSLSSDFAFPEPLLDPSNTGTEYDEEDEDSFDWKHLGSDLEQYFEKRSPGSDVDDQGLFKSQIEAFTTSMALAESSETMAEVLTQTSKNLIDLVVHLLGKCNSTENELLAAVGKLEERKGRHEEVKAMYVEKKKLVETMQKENKKLERDVEAYKLRADRSEMQAELYQSQTESLKEELNNATKQLEQLQTKHLELSDKEKIEKITLRGKGISRQLERQASKVEMNVAALTAELEALELSPRVEHEEDESPGGGSVSDVTPRYTTDNRRTNNQIYRYQCLINELVRDNDVLQSEYLELVNQMRSMGSTSESTPSHPASPKQPRSRTSSGSLAINLNMKEKKSLFSRRKPGRKKEGESDSEDVRTDDEGELRFSDSSVKLKENEIGLLRASKAKLETVIRDLLADKKLLETALRAEIKTRSFH